MICRLYARELADLSLRQSRALLEVRNEPSIGAVSNRPVLTTDQWSQELQSITGIAILDDGNPVGCIYLRPALNANTEWGIYLLPAYRSRGIGKHFGRMFLDMAHRLWAVDMIWAEVKAANDHSVSLHTELGFIGEAKNSDHYIFVHEDRYF